MPNLHPFARVVRAQADRRTPRIERPAISSFNPAIVAACALWEWDRQGPLRQRAA